MKISVTEIKRKKEFPKYILTESSDKLVVNTGNLKFLASCIYASNHYPVRIIIDEGGEDFTYGFVVYISKEFLICIDTSSANENFQSIFKIPVDSFSKLCYNGCRFKIYIKESLCK